MTHTLKARPAQAADATASPLWFAEDGGPFHGHEPSYFDPADFPWVAEVELKWEVIRDELKALLEADQASLTPYANTAMTTQPGRWKTFGMMFWLNRFSGPSKKCPRTMQILSRVPGLAAVSFNLLEPNSSIKPHRGDTNAIIRCHMGLDVPDTAPRCAFRVGGEVRSWENGKFLLFCDAHEHTAWNNTDRDRYILVIDIFRTQFHARRKAIASRVLASITLALILQRGEWLRRHCSRGFSRAVLFALLRMRYYLPLALNPRA